MVNLWNCAQHWNTSTLLAFICVTSLYSKQIRNDLTRNTICWDKDRLNLHRKNVCQRNPELMKQVDGGIINGLHECQRQFAMGRWNCTTTHKTYKRVQKSSTRQAAYLNAIISAGVLHSVTSACSAGLLWQCHCKKTSEHIQVKNPSTNSAETTYWQWGGCSDDISYGYNKSTQFTDKTNSVSDIKALIRHHNSEAGRQTIIETMKKVCKCHGLSGSCSVRTCWKVMAPFQTIGKLLKDKYDGSSKVIGSNDGDSLIPEDKRMKSPTKSDLVYSIDSPNFCEKNRRFGSTGTYGRYCNTTSINEDSCDLLCCNRGYITKRIVVREKCECKFIWCCSVQCDTCVREVIVGICN